jgi:hypothetical protein
VAVKTIFNFERPCFFNSRSRIKVMQEIALGRNGRDPESKNWKRCMVAAFVAVRREGEDLCGWECVEPS